MGNISKYPMLIKSNENTELFSKKDKCDKYDYLIAAGCGAIGGLIDIFLVGMPGDSVIGKWTDTQVDNCVIKFAKMVDKDNKVKEGNIASAIGFLEKNFKVNYDQKNSTNVGNLFRMGTKNHHMKSLAHSPDIIGLFFSILNQFTLTSTFLNDGQLITIQTDSHELAGKTLIAKIFCGAANWFGHLMSDIAGSSGGRGNVTGGRGSGIVIPFFEMFGLCNFGEFNIGKDRQDLATLATRVFQEGYDARFGMAMAIPVLVCDLLIRLIWSLRRFFQYKKPIRECIPTAQHDDLRIMLLIGNGTLCVLDGADALFRSGGNALMFFMRLNLVAWFRFISLVIKEVLIRLGFNTSIQDSIDAMKRVHAALTNYLKELEKIDIELFKKETEMYNQMVEELSMANSEQDLTLMLIAQYEHMGIALPWKGYDSFDDFMQDKNSRLVFE
ncbi:MAG: hypothetical protein NC299_08425 [Lachnospiraceae bacterium]|nr:hypothetical protein [Ruminococcus sp.]MCM1275378.1 hypothetical protein [Lachnospiraceae bacterium]